MKNYLDEARWNPPIAVKNDGSPINFMRDSSNKKYLNEPNPFFQGMRFVLAFNAVTLVMIAAVFFMTR